MINLTGTIAFNDGRGEPVLEGLVFSVHKISYLLKTPLR